LRLRLLRFLRGDQLRVLARQPDVDVAVGKLGRDLECDLRQRVDQAEGRGLLDRALQPMGRLDELLPAELRQFAQVALESFDELCRLHDSIMTSSQRLSSVNRAST